MERGDHSELATFFAAAFERGGTVDLDEVAAQHVHVRRLAVGDRVRLTDGQGNVAIGRIQSSGKRATSVAVEETHPEPKPQTLRMLVPVADRDRMLWLAEKCAELEVTVWQPVVFRRSLSVSPRGEGPAFARKVRSRMRSALEQSGGAWLPELRPPQPLVSVLADAEISGSCRFLLDRDGAPLVGQRAHGEASVLLGPEGGLDSAELRLARGEHGWMLASLGARTLRFETAGVIAAGILRSQLASSRTH